MEKVIDKRYKIIAIIWNGTIKKFKGAESVKCVIIYGLQRSCDVICKPV